MKITESTSISIKLLIPIIGMAVGFGGWMYRVDSVTTDLKSKSIYSSKKLKKIEADVSEIKVILMDERISGIGSDDEDFCYGTRCYGGQVEPYSR